MLRPTNWTRRLAVVTLVALGALPVLAGCGGAAAPAAGTTPAKPAATTPQSSSKTASTGSASTAAATPVTLRLPWLSSGPDIPFYLALQKGYYKDAGLNVTIEPGKSSLFTSETVANGKDTFGFADATALAGVVSKGGKLKMVAQIIDTSPVGIIHRPDVTLKTAKDLEGQTILTNSAGGPVIAMLHAVLAAQHVPVSSLHLDIVNATGEAQSFASRPHDLLTGFCNSTFPAANLLVPSAVCTLDTHLAPSVRALSYGIMTSDNELQAHPDVVRKFVAASIKGWQYAIAHPQAILAPTLKEAQDLNQHPPKMATWKVGWQQTLAGLNQPKGKPFGYAEASAWSTMLPILHRYANLTPVLPLADYYTNAYLPKS